MSPAEDREFIKLNIVLLPAKNIANFKRMYSPKDIYRNIHEVIDAIPYGKVHWARTQIENTLGDIDAETT